MHFLSGLPMGPSLLWQQPEPQARLRAGCGLLPGTARCSSHCAVACKVKLEAGRLAAAAAPCGRPMSQALGGVQVSTRAAAGTRAPRKRSAASTSIAPRTRTRTRTGTGTGIAAAGTKGPSLNGVTEAKVTGATGTPAVAAEGSQVNSPARARDGSLLLQANRLLIKSHAGLVASNLVR